MPLGVQPMSTMSEDRDRVVDARLVGFLAGVIAGASIATLIIVLVLSMVSRGQPQPDTDVNPPQRRQPTPSYPYYPPNGATTGATKN
jgi:hypothetical protein